ncbi:MAG TPA: MFS transporter [Acidimicrobiales bacterium]|nr:MFS transporter [Acidimicrobiales bacterium]
MASAGGTQASAQSLRKVLVPLALAQFICSFAGSNMNVMIDSISKDLNTTVQGVQVCITLFLIVMAALMIPCGKLTDRYGRKRCFTVGLTVYGVGALLSAAAPGLGVLILGNSFLEGIGTALLIPPVYILTTILFTDMKSRARAFGVISGMGGVGAATGPLIGGAITTAISWRAAFVFQALIIVVIVILARGVIDPIPPDPQRPFDTVGSILSAAGLVVLVLGILAADKNLALMAVGLVVGALILAGFFAWVRRREREQKEALLSMALFRNRTANLAMVTQNIQWLLLMGSSFVVSVYLQVVRGYNAVQTGVIFTAATLGILVSSLAAGRLARRFAQRTLILAGFVTTLVGIVLLLALVKGHPGAWYFAPGLLLIGLGLGVMLTPSVNVVQSAFPENMQGEISGLSRSVSNLGSSFGTAIAGTILVSGLTDPKSAYGAAMLVLAAVGLVGLAATIAIPTTQSTAAPEPTG